ncbi:MAG: bifunctional riboflavin kinase/FAD synthetase [Nitriliruptoraceae bacterium]
MTHVVRDPAALDRAPSVVTVGNFDGVHRGHQVLLRRTVTLAAEHGARAVAVTFDPHPATVLRPGAAPPLLQPLSERVTRLVEAGLDAVVVLPFTRELASMSPAGFVRSVLAGPLASVRVVVGTNFRFGARAAGDVVTLLELGEQHGFSPEAVTLLELDGRRISSSAIREHLTAGEVDWPRSALGRPYQLTGVVVPGDGRGRTIGVPTANLHPQERLVVPGAGVYAGHAEVAGEWLPAVTNVGVRPTFDGQIETVEVHLLDTEVDLYGAPLTFRFEHRLRGEQRFDGPEQLVAQITRDIQTARLRLAEA